jgi:predicted DNA-binding protein (MmcQ/YjbR family)
VTIDELRAFCLSLPETHEQETWGDAEHAGDVTFRVKGKIYLITGQEGGGASIRTDREQQADLLAAFPEDVSMAPYVGRFGWVSVRLDRLDGSIIRDIIVSAWRRTAPKAAVAAFDADVTTDAGVR